MTSPELYSLRQSVTGYWVNFLEFTAANRAIRMAKLKAPEASGTMVQKDLLDISIYGTHAQINDIIIPDR